MKVLMQFGLCCLLASGALAQHHGGGGGGGHTGFAGGGMSRGGYTSGMHAGGYGNRGYANHAYRAGYRYGRHFYRPWYYGAYWPGPWDYGSWDSSYYDQANPYPAAYSYGGWDPVMIVNVPAPEQPVYVVDRPAHPVMRVYRQPEDYGLPSEHENHPVIYLIAFNDRVIHPAMTYWADGSTLHYLDMDHKEKQAPLATVDRDFSAELNRERHVPFRLPAP